MRIVLINIALLLACQIFAQQKGVHPVGEKTATEASGATYAVIVGISDYQNADITDLRYAHRDAESFAEFLRSPAGGAIPDQQLIVLLNEQATAGQFAAALDGLIEKAKENDQVIIYFSGHGDVERKTISQPGFLLCWNSPARVYMGGGTYALLYLQEIISTLSVQNKAKVLVITDACHAGKLAGSSIGGASITGANLARQYANETKILSCQPDELSLEGAQWGGGRGVFSYHLIDGLYGLADRNDDGFITVSEMDRYLEDHVTAEADPQSQIPILIGNKTERLAVVDPASLELVKQRKTGESSVFSAVDTRGLEEQVLARVDSNIREDYQAFLTALKNKQFFEPAGKNAEALYARLSTAPELAELQGYLKRNYAAALQDEAQVAINDYLSADPQELRKRWSFDNRYKPFPQYLARAAGLLGEKHYLYNDLKAREYYFAGLNLRLQGEQTKDTLLFYQAITLQQQTLQLDSNAAYAYNELGQIHRDLRQPQQAIVFFKKAINCTPKWILPWANLCAVLTDKRDLDQAIDYGQQALKLDSSYAMTHYNLGLAYQLKPDFTRAKSHYQMAIRYDPNYMEAYFNIGLIHYREENYPAAEKVWLEYARLKPQDPGVYQNLLFAKVEQKQLDAALKYLEQALANGGFPDQNELDTDAQLVELRKLPGYAELIKKYFPKKK